MRPLRYLLLLGLLLTVLSQVAAQRYSFLSNGTIQDALPAITAETFSFYLVPTHQDGFPEGIRLRWKDRAGNASSWHEFHQDSHAEAGHFHSQLGFAERGEWTDFELEMVANGPVTLYIFDPGVTETLEKPLTQLEGALCFKPLVEERNDWCPSGNCPVDATPAPTTTTHLIVHHSAGSNAANDWAAVVRSIWDFHVNGNGWDDVGYNYLIDPEGTIYVGRGNDIRGAHFCGNNTNTMGFCLLGTFTSQTPTAAALESLAELLSWKCQSANIDPLATSFHAPSNFTLNNLAGHRQGCSTACPGEAFFNVFGDFRQQVADELASCQTSSTTEPTPAWAADLRIFPNPGVGEVSITGAPVGAHLQLFTASGQLLFQASASSVTSVEAMLGQSAAGVFWLRVEAEGGAVVRKLIRQR